jgi:hypothetical protein
MGESLAGGLLPVSLSRPTLVKGVAFGSFGGFGGSREDGLVRWSQFSEEQIALA